jgi:hypothetical protein
MKIKKPISSLPQKEATLGFFEVTPSGAASNKTLDTMKSPVSIGGRVDSYYSQNGFRDFSEPGKELKKQIQPSEFIEKFGFRGLEFGNWVTNEDRVNFLKVAMLSLPGFAKVLGVAMSKIGLKGYVGLAYGARGRTKNPAHFEPSTGMINLTRYERTSNNSKPKEFFKSGGLGSFDHEWGHALDYFLGTYVDQHKDSRALSFGAQVIMSTRKWAEYEKINLPKGSFRYLMRNILAAIMFTERGKTFSPYYARLVKEVKSSESGFGEYWIRCNELFARSWEQYMDYKLTQKKLNKGFFETRKFDDYSVGDLRPYLNASELKKVIPLFDTLVKKFASEIGKA